MGLILISQKDYKPVREIYPETMSVQLKERDSSASFTAGDITNVTIKSWLRDDTNPGKNIVWRVKSISQAYLTDTWTVQLEHVISLLRDQILFGEVKPATITGKKGDTTCTAKQAVSYILGKQSDWVLGDMTKSLANTKNPYKFDGDSLLDALEKVTDSLEGAVWSYDTSSHPFKLNITIPSGSVQSEMRVSRNIRTISKTIDKSGMFTRFYPIGKNDLHVNKNGYVQKNTSSYGVISKVETDSELDTAAELSRWANEQLNKHAQPSVTIEVDGLELADATGESLDRFGIGRLCRVPLPEFGGSVIQERIAGLSYQDKINQPEAVRVTLSNTRKDVTKIIAEAIKKAGSGGRSAAKRDKEDNAWMEDTDDHVAMCAKGIIGTDAKGNPNWVTLSQLIVDGKGIHSTVTEIQGNQKEYGTKIEQLSKSISLVVGKYDKDGRYVDAAKICLAINDSGDSEATIKADKIYLLGKTIANKIDANYIKTKIASMSSVTVTTLNAKNYIYADDFVIGKNTGGQGTNKYVSNAITELKFKKSGGTVTLQKKGFKSKDWVDVDSFERATALSGEWSGGKITMSANASNVPDLVHVIKAGDPSWNNRTVTIPINAYTEQDRLIGPTGREVTAYYDLKKSQINLARTKKNSEPTGMDGTLSAITANSWYQMDITVAGVEAHWKVQVNVPDAHTHSLSVTQSSAGSTSARRFEAFYKSGTTYVSMGTYYWYRSGSDLNSAGTAKTLYYA